MANITVDFAEESGSPTEGWDDTGVFSATRRLRCNWDDRLKLANQLRGYTSGAYSGAAKYPALNNARVRSVAIAPGTSKIVNDAGLARYEHAVLTVTYGTSKSERTSETEDPADNVIIEESLTPSAEYITQGTINLYWADDTPVQIEEAPGLMIRMLEWSVTLHNVTDAFNNINQYLGSVNDRPVRSMTFGDQFGTGCVLFASHSKSHAITEQGSQPWTHNYSFLIRTHDWNLYPRSGRPEPEFLYRDLNASQHRLERLLPYPYIDFQRAIRVKVNY